MPTNEKLRLECCLAWAGQGMLIYVRDHSDMVGTRHVRIDWFGGQLVNIAWISTVKVVLNASFHQNKDFGTMGHGIKVMFYDTN